MKRLAMVLALTFTMGLASSAFSANAKDDTKKAKTETTKTETATTKKEGTTCTAAEKKSCCSGSATCAGAKAEKTEKAEKK